MAVNTPLDSLIVKPLSKGTAQYIPAKDVRDMVSQLPEAVSCDRAIAESKINELQAQINDVKALHANLNPQSASLRHVYGPQANRLSSSAAQGKTEAPQALEIQILYTLEAKLRKEIRELNTSFQNKATQTAEIRKLRTENQPLKSENDKLRNENGNVKAEINKIKAVLDLEVLAEMRFDFLIGIEKFTSLNNMLHKDVNRLQQELRTVQGNASYHVPGETTGPTGFTTNHQGVRSKCELTVLTEDVAFGTKPVVNLSSRLNPRKTETASLFPTASIGMSRKRSASAETEERLTKKPKVLVYRFCVNCRDSGLECNQKSPCNNCGPHMLSCVYSISPNELMCRGAISARFQDRKHKAFKQEAERTQSTEAFPESVHSSELATLSPSVSTKPHPWEPLAEPRDFVGFRD